MTKYSHSPYTSTYRSTPHNTNRKHIITSPTQTHNILQHSKAKKTTIFNNGRYTTNIPTDPHTVTTTDIKTNMRHIHTSIVSRHLATRGNNKILRTPPPHTSSSEERLPRLSRRTLAQLRTNKSPFLKSYLHKVDAKSHPSPLCPLCNIHTHERYAGQMDGEAGWWTTSGNIGLPPLARVMGVGRQQHFIRRCKPVLRRASTSDITF